MVILYHDYTYLSLYTWLWPWKMTKYYERNKINGEMSKMNGHVKDGNEFMYNRDIQSGYLAWPSSNLMNVYAKNASNIPLLIF